MKNPSMEALARLMFDAYNRTGPNPGKTWDGRDVPPFDQCGAQVQAKWEAAAQAALDAANGPAGSFAL